MLVTDPLGVVSGDGDSVADGDEEDGAAGDGDGEVGDGEGDVGEGDGEVGDGDGGLGVGGAECDGAGVGECVGDGAGGAECDGAGAEEGGLGVTIACWLPEGSSRSAERRK